MAGKLYQLMSRLHMARSRSSSAADVPRDTSRYTSGERRKRFVIPTAYLRNPSFLLLLKRVEDEFGFDNQAAGGITIPCLEGDFADIVGGCSSSPSSWADTSCGSCDHTGAGACIGRSSHRCHY